MRRPDPRMVSSSRCRCQSSGGAGIGDGRASGRGDVVEGEAGGDRVEVRVAATSGGQQASPACEMGDAAAAAVLHWKRGT